MDNYKIASRQTLQDFFYEPAIMKMVEEDNLGAVYQRYLENCIEDIKAYLAQVDVNPKEYLTLNDCSKIVAAVQKSLSK